MIPSSANTETPRPPQRGRYPSSLTRVPLHRRGTSNTYECLEDLLREAGYKETRVFTPERERIDIENSVRAANTSSTHVSSKGGVGSSGFKMGVGMVVDFLSGLVPNPSPSPAQSDQTPTPSGSLIQNPVFSHRSRPPSSARTHRTGTRHSPDSESAMTMSRSTTASSSLDSLVDSCPPSSPLMVTISRPHSRPIPRLRLPPPQPSYSKAHAYLRHISSAPSMQQQHQRGDVTTRMNQENHPPLPKSWLETVARSVLLGVPTAFIGGPITSPNLPRITSRAATPQSPPLRQMRSSLSRFGRSWRSPRTNSPAAPVLCTRIQNGNGKSARSIGEVSRTCVVCRSAPGSRANSPERGESGVSGDRVRDGRRQLVKRREEKSTHPSRNGSRPQSLLKKKRGRRMNKDQDAVPTLARTRVEGDVWSTTQGGRDPSHERPSDSPSLVEDEEEEGSDGELDLAMMLGPPTRQKSIRSLRRHLASTPSASRGRPNRVVESARGLVRLKQGIVDLPESSGEEDDERWWQSRKAVSGRDEENEESRLGLPEPAKRGGKKRMRLPEWKRQPAVVST